MHSNVIFEITNCLANEIGNCFGREVTWKRLTREADNFLGILEPHYYI